MYSFYGGHPGSSVNITGHYTTYENLVNAFQSTNCPVRVGEYASKKALTIGELRYAIIA